MSILELSSLFIDDIKLRFLKNNDIENLKKLCTEWFPIKYPDAWYEEVTNNRKFFSLAATYNNQTIGVIIAEIRNRNQCNTEDSDILGYWYPSDTKVAYILILGVSKEYRRKGVASLLLKAFLTQVEGEEHHQCKVVYLHVLSTNPGAVVFYERHSFKRHKHLPFYYAIQGQKMDGLSYAFYVNDGCPPWTLSDVVGKVTDYFTQFGFCRASSYLLSRIWLISNKLLVKQTASRIVRNL